MANVWLRLIDKSFVQTDLVLLLHEYSESLIVLGISDELKKEDFLNN